MSTKQLVAFFYTQLDSGNYRCNICDQPRKQAFRTGYTNLPPPRQASYAWRGVRGVPAPQPLVLGGFWFYGPGHERHVRLAALDRRPEPPAL